MLDYLPPVEDEEEEEKAPLYMVTCCMLNVRMGPGTSYAKLGTISRGTLIFGEYENGWVNFTYNGQTAYSSADYLMQVDGRPLWPARDLPHAECARRRGHQL